MRRLHRIPIPFLLAVAVALGLAACGDDGPTPRPTPDAGSAVTAPTPDAAPSVPEPIRFVKGVAAGIEAAGDPDALLFVYLGRHSPT